MKSTGLDRFKELYPVFSHKLNNVWNNLSPKVCNCLDSMGVSWMTIDTIQFVKVRKGEALCPIVLWIGVPPRLSFMANVTTIY